MISTRKLTQRSLLALLLLAQISAHATLSGTYIIDPSGTASPTLYNTLTSAISDMSSGTRADGGTR